MPIPFDAACRDAAEKLIRAGFEEDLHDLGDVTSQGLVLETEMATAQLVARAPGRLSGLPIAQLVFSTLDANIDFEARATDGDTLSRGQVLADVSGPLRSLLTGERTALNFLTHLSGVATLTQQFVAAVQGTRAGIYDTRKTHPGWRVLEKYAVLCGGGRNHRMGLFDMVLIKDNHLAGWLAARDDRTIADAVRTARARAPRGTPVEVEVDSLTQLVDALDGQPDMVLLDNMTCDQLREGVAIRDAKAPKVELEASGGVRLETVADIARTGVDRISAGALTHSAPALDIAFDWKQR